MWQAAAETQRQEAITSAQTRLVAVTDERSELELYGTPFLFTAAGLLPSNYETAHTAYRAVSLLAITLTLFLAALAGGWGMAGATAISGALLLLCAPIHSDLRVGNVNAIQAALVLTGCLLIGRKRDGSLLTAGFLFGLAVMLKPNVALVPVVLVLLMAMTRRMKSAGVVALGTALGGGLAAGVSMLFLGSGAAWLDWYRLFSKLPPAIISRSSGNISLAREMERSFGADLSIPLFVVAASLLAWGAWRNRDRIDPERSLEAILFTGAAILVTLFSSDLVWLHYPVLILTAAVALTGPASPLLTRILAASALLFVSYEPLFRLLRFDWGRWPLPVVNAGMILLFATILFFARWQQTRR